MRAEIGQILHTDTLTHAAKLVVRVKVGLGPIEFAMADVRHSAIVNPASQLLLTRRDKQ